MFLAWTTKPNESRDHSFRGSWSRGFGASSSCLCSVAVLRGLCSVAVLHTTCCRKTQRERLRDDNFTSYPVTIFKSQSTFIQYITIAFHINSQS